MEGHEGKLGDDGNVLYHYGGGGYITEFVKTLQNLFKLVHFLYVYYISIKANEMKKIRVSP